jgi:hypothetical protein
LEGFRQGNLKLEQQGKYNTLTEFFFSTNQSVKQSDFGGAE